jgi:hypothetical protein
VGLDLGEAVSQTIATLIDYYLKCLEKERRDELKKVGGASPDGILFCKEKALSTWKELFATDAAVHAFQTLRGRDDIAVLFSPVIFVSPEGSLEPAAGVFCYADRGRLRADPADLWLGSIIGQALSEEQYLSRRDTLEKAAASSPKEFAQTLSQILNEDGFPITHSVKDTEDLPDLPGGSVTFAPAFWLVETRAEFDRGLVRELEQLREKAQADRLAKGTALSILTQPPSAVPVDVGAVITALANPASPTYSQAVALAHAVSQKLTVITGPPGTGKTRVIAALIIECLISRQTTLLASKINNAVDAAVALVERLIGGGAVLRTGNQDARAELAQTASRLSGLSKWPKEGEVFSAADETAGASAPKGNVLKRWQRRVEKLRRLAPMLEAYGPGPVRWWQWLRRRRQAEFEREWYALETEIDAELSNFGARRAERLNELLHSLNSLVSNSKAVLSQLSLALQTGTRERHRAFRDVVRRGFPVAVTNLAVSSNLPLEPGMFDLLIVDEASTCDPASLLPLLYRAKRAVIVGDPHQLPHVTKDGWKQVLPVPTLLGADKCEFSAEFGSSAYHLCSNIYGAQNTLLLSDHFRCPPPIISFSNESFYGGALRIHSEDVSGPLDLRLVSSQHRVTPSGSRVNDEQLSEAIKQLVDLSERFKRATIGLVTPYRAMADAAVELAKQHPSLSPLIDQQRLIIGTAHRFQGSEVDFLVFATTAGSNAGRRELSWVEHPNLFNVAITRAKKRLIVIADPVLWQSGSLRRTKGLFDDLGKLRADSRQSPPELKEALEQLEALGVQYNSPSSFRGYPLDIIDASDSPKWAVVFVGWSELQNFTLASMLQRWSDRTALAKWGIRLYYATPVTWSRVLTRMLSDEWLS